MARSFQLLLCSVWILHSFLLCAEGKRPTPKALFVFGDSYSDTGNHDPAIPPYNIPWLPPFGITWPHKKGQGGGRYSDGKISTDILAELLGLPTPATDRSYETNPSAAPRSLRHGVNFGSGGAGVFKTFEVPTVYQQVDSFQNITATFPDVFTPTVIAKSVVLFINVGNDYSLFKGTEDELPAYVQSVVDGMVNNMEKMYQLGLRNFIVSNMHPGACLPLYGLTGSLTPETCGTDPANALSLLHNGLLAAAVSNLQSTLRDSHFVILDAFKAFGYVVSNAKHFGLRSDPLAPCCNGIPGTTASFMGITLPRCGFTDAQGPIYTVCEDPTNSFWWDEAHPTQAAYTALYSLFFSGYNFTFPAPNLRVWTSTSNFARKSYRSH